MKKTRKISFCIAATAILTIGTASIAFGEWRFDEWQGVWRYYHDDGSYVSNGWQWIDGNMDGTAECYYFDADGRLLVNTATPDGYSVNENGAWVENGSVQVKATVIGSPLTEVDFVVQDEYVSINTPDSSIITYFAPDILRYAGHTGAWVQMAYSAGDELTTARGITLGYTGDKVVSQYGGILVPYDKEDDNLYLAVPAETKDSQVIGSASKTLTVYTEPYGIRFYFDQEEKLIGVIYWIEVD